MAFVVLEGPDGGGKTTLAARMERAYGVSTRHLGPPKSDERLAEIIEHMLDLGEFHHPRNDLIFDRLHFGSLAYGTVFRGKPDLSRRETLTFERILERMGAIVILCTPGWDEVEKNVRKKSPDDEHAQFHDVKSMASVCRLMELAYVDCVLPKTVYDYRVEGALDIVGKFVEFNLGWEGQLDG